MDIDGFPVWIFFVGFIVVGTLFGLNLFVAVITSKYQQYAAKEREARRKERLAEPPKPAGARGLRTGCRYALKTFIKTRTFSSIIFVRV